MNARKKSAKPTTRSVKVWVLTIRSKPVAGRWFPSEAAAKGYVEYAYSPGSGPRVWGATLTLATPKKAGKS